MSGDKAEIAFFDVETTVPTRAGQGRAILEFGAILVCPKKLIELDHYSTLVRPHDLSLIFSLSDRSNGITMDAVVSAPTFADIADKVYEILHGRIWVGHNILRFDGPLIREAFSVINRPPPEPKGTLDSLDILTQKFGRRAGDMKMATLATHFELGPQTHRSLDDVRMNLEVLKNCATVLFLESSLPDVFTENSWVSPDEVSVANISVKHQVLHHSIPLQLCCKNVQVRFGVSLKFVDFASPPRLTFVVNASESVCNVLSKIDEEAQKLFVDSGSNSEWRPIVNWNYPAFRLYLPSRLDGDILHWVTEIYQEESSTMQRLPFSRYNATELESLLTSGTFVDVYFSFDPYHYPQNAGVRLVAKKLIIHSN